MHHAFFVELDEAVPSTRCGTPPPNTREDGGSEAIIIDVSAMQCHLTPAQSQAIASEEKEVAVKQSWFSALFEKLNSHVKHITKAFVMYFQTWAENNPEESGTNYPYYPFVHPQVRVGAHMGPVLLKTL